MATMRFYAVLLILFGFGLGYFDFASQAKHFKALDRIHVTPREKLQKYALKLGLDLQGGTHLVYKADTDKLATSTRADAKGVGDSMEALRDVIDRRVNLFGVAEPLVQVEQASFLSENTKEQRLIVELPGLTDVDKAVAMIGATPVLEFKLERPTEERDAILKAQDEYRTAVDAAKISGASQPKPENPLLFQEVYAPTELTGRYLTKAELQFDNNSAGGGLHDPRVGITFNDEGKDLFAKITRENVGKQLAIYLDGAPISAPTIREEISSGNAEISGNFKLEEAKQLVGRLNSGALPVPIELLSAQSIGATLGGEAYAAVVKAGILGFLIVVCFMIFWYRLPGLVAGISLSIYAALMLAIFKLLPVTMTAAGIAGFILSIGMAVDANILIFERMKEETRRGRALRDAMLEGFARAWTSIRDSNLSSIISAIILFWFGTSMVKGFALVLGIGVAVSMFTALTVTRTLLLSLGVAGEGKVTKFLFGTGIKN